VLAAAGNQGRLAMGQLLSHPVTVPVEAVDTAGRAAARLQFRPRDIAWRRRGVRSRSAISQPMASVTIERRTTGLAPFPFSRTND
jgi:hypothetical protein